MKPDTLAKLRNAFDAGLKAKSVERGLRVENRAAPSTGELYLYDSIGRDWMGGGIAAADVAEALASLQGCKTLNVYINSPGGSVFDGKAIFNQLSRFPATKNIYIDGVAASIATVIACAGDKIVTGQGATWMVHQAMAGAEGYAEDLRAMADVLDLETQNIAGIYEKRTGCPAADCLKMMAAETWMDAAQAKELGFSDETAGEDCAPPDKKMAAAVAAAPVAAVVSPPLAAVEKTQTILAEEAATARRQLALLGARLRRSQRVA